MALKLGGRVTDSLGVVVLTGASGGIGRATAVALARAGFTLALVGRAPSGLAQTLGAVQAIGGKAEAFEQDVTDYPELEGLVHSIATRLGTVVGLVNNAGFAMVSPLEQMPLADFERVLAVNLTAVLALTQQVIPYLRAHGGGVIVNMASIAGVRTFPQWGAYCASKFGLVALSRTLAQELRLDGIRVTTLCPGAVDTPLWNDLDPAGYDRSRMLSPETVAQLVVQIFTLPAQAVLEEAILMPAGGAL
ncbi:SDR family oxidoreductase [Anthocerotibacter panamensis]|uniref:SDR family oxidoreductase n=1 Tax=Anthocerotibacter panamensis TaxID=2857077 RepID=UPI001C404562|nr:SDR family oxidoreductase [Anthocerotibacter panamensis]